MLSFKKCIILKDGRQRQLAQDTMESNKSKVALAICNSGQAGFKGVNQYHTHSSKISPIT